MLCKSDKPSIIIIINYANVAIKLSMQPRVPGSLGKGKAKGWEATVLSVSLHFLCEIAVHRCAGVLTIVI